MGAKAGSEDSGGVILPSAQRVFEHYGKYCYPAQSFFFFFNPGYREKCKVTFDSLNVASSFHP